MHKEEERELTIRFSNAEVPGDLDESSFIGGLSDKACFGQAQERMEGEESVSIDKSYEEFHCKGEQRNWAASCGGRQSQEKIYFRWKK